MATNAGLCDELHVAVSSKKSVDPNEQEDVSVLLAGLRDKVFVLAHDLNRRKGRLPLHGQRGWLPHHPDNDHCQ